MNTPAKQELYQAAFDKAVLAVLKQGKACVGPQGGCKYANGAGDHCAIGHLLSEWPPGIEGTFAFEQDPPFQGDAIDSAMRAIGFTPEDARFIKTLQRAHDEAQHAVRRSSGQIDFIPRFKVEAGLVAHEFNLTLPQECIK